MELNYIIIEDEEPAAARLEKMVSALVPGAVCLARLVSVKSSIKWFEQNKHPDLAFMDIRLADGNSFEIFKSIVPACPVIFVTAYDQYAIEAFKVNSIDYLLKPVKQAELDAALSKFFSGRANPLTPLVDYRQLMEVLTNEPEYQKRLLVRFGDTIKAVEIADVAYFFTEDKANFLMTFGNVRYPVDENLDGLEEILDPKLFFRVNRQFIIHIKAIARMSNYTRSRVKIELDPPPGSDILVSAARSHQFRSWLTGKSI